MILDLDALLTPIPGTDPAGPNLRGETALSSIYFKLKDARAQARTAERAAEAAGELPAVPPEWQVVRSLAQDALATRSKDLEVAAWLVEAMLRLEGFAGLAAGFALNKGLVDRFWPHVHSIDEDDDSGRVSPLSGLNGIGGDGALVQPIRMVPLLPDSAYGTNALWHLTRVQKEPDSPLARDFNDARASVGMAAIRDRAIEASHARDSFTALCATLEERCGDDAPPSSNIRNALDDVIDAYRSLVGSGMAIESQEPPRPVETTEVSAGTVAVAQQPPTPVPAAPVELASREDAFTELLRIADFFRRNEPHSPISYSLETLVWRGRMSFVDLLEELMPDASHRRQILQHAGIHANTEGKTR